MRTGSISWGWRSAAPASRSSRAVAPVPRECRFVCRHRRTVLRALLPILALLLSLVTDGGARAENVLPPGYQLPSVKRPAPSPSDHLSSWDGLQVAGYDRVRVAFKLDRSGDGAAEQVLDLIIGYDQDWTPGGYHPFFPQGYEGSPKLAYVFTISTMIVFPKTFSPDMTEPMHSTSQPDYTLSQQGDYVVLTRLAHWRWYYESIDGGQSWRLAKVERVTRPGRFTTIEYDEAGLARAVVYPNGQRVTLEYSGDHVVRIDTPFGESYHLKRNASSHIDEVEIHRAPGSSGEGRSKGPTLVARHQFKRDAQGRITHYTAPSGNEYTCGFTPTTTHENKTLAQKWVTTIHRAHDGLVQIRRDENREGEEWITQQARARLSPSGEILDEVQSFGIRMRKIAGMWRLSGVSYSDPTQLITYQYDPKANSSLQVYPGGSTTATTHFNDLLKPTAISDTDGQQARMEYNDLGQETRRVESDGRERIQRHDEHGRLVERVDFNGRTFLFSYDDRGLPSGVRVDDAEHVFQFDDWARLTEWRKPDGSVLQWSYDSLGRLVKEAVLASVEIASGPATSATPASEASPSASGETSGGAVTTISYTWQGDRLVSVDHHRGAAGDDVRQERFAYDPQGRLRNHMREDGSRVSYQYDRRTGWLQGKFDTTGPNDTWTYYPTGVMRSHRSQKDQGTLRITEYGAIGNIVAEVLPGRGRVVYDASRTSEQSIRRSQDQ